MTVLPAPFALERLSGHIAAEVLCDDLGRTLSDPQAREDLRLALSEHLVLVFRGLDPSPEQQVELASLFGVPEPPESYNPSLPENPLVCVFDSTEGYVADRWHADLTWKSEITLGAVLCMRQAPSVGGDTLWTNCHAAYDGLSGGMQRLLEGRRARHDISPDPEHGTEHPVVVTHPDTGRKALFVNEIFTRRIVNLPQAESEALLPFLFREISRVDYMYRHSWAEGDVVVWDNRTAQHFAMADYDERRIVHRVGINGWEPTA